MDTPLNNKPTVSELLSENENTGEPGPALVTEPEQSTEPVDKPVDKPLTEPVQSAEPVVEPLTELETIQPPQFADPGEVFSTLPNIPVSISDSMSGPNVGLDPVMETTLSSEYTSEPNTDSTLPPGVISASDPITDTTIEQPVSPIDSDLKEHILHIDDFEEGDSIILYSLDETNIYHNKVVDFLYIENNVIVVLDNQSDSILELSIENNTIQDNSNKIYKIKKKVETSHSNLHIVRTQHLTNIEIIESGVEIQERLLSNWEREWSDEEYRQSIVDNLKLVYAHKSYYDIDTISKDLFELIHDQTLKNKDVSVFTNEDNVNMLNDIQQNIYTHPFIKPIIIDKRKIYSNKEKSEILFTKSDSDNKYIHRDDIELLDNKESIDAEHSIHIRHLLYKNKLTSPELALNQDEYENELVNGVGKTPLLDEMGRISNDPTTEHVLYNNISKPYLNTAIDSSHFNFEYFMMEHGLNYKTAVYRPNITHSMFTIDNQEDIFLDSNMIESRIADSNYYRYYDVLDKRCITDSFGRIKASQVCHGIKGEYMYSGSFTRKEHKASAFNKSITKLPVRHKHIEGEKLLICGLVLHNIQLYNPSFIEHKYHIDENGKFILHYKTNDDGYNIYDYVLQNNKNIDRGHIQVYDIQKNKQTYVYPNVQDINYNHNNFIYFNPNKSYTIPNVSIDDDMHTIRLQDTDVIIENNSTKEQTITNIQDDNISQVVIDSMIAHKLIYIDSQNKRRILKQKLKEAQYLESIRKIVPSIKDIFNYETKQAVKMNTIHNSYNIKDMNKILSKYKLTYNDVPRTYRQQMKKIIKRNTTTYKQYVRKQEKNTKILKKNKSTIQKIFKTLHAGVSKAIKYIYYYKNFTSLNISKDTYLGPKPELENITIQERESEDEFKKRQEQNEIQYKTNIIRWEGFNKEFDSTTREHDVQKLLIDQVQKRIISKCHYILQHFSTEELEIFLAYITHNKPTMSKSHTTDVSQRIDIFTHITEILYSRFNTFHYNNLFLNDLSLDSYQNFCLLLQPGITTHYCSSKSLGFLNEFYTYNSLHIYDTYDANSSIQLNRNNLQLIEIISHFKKKKTPELLFDIYKTIQIEREIVNINEIVTTIYSEDKDVFVSLDDMLEQAKEDFMILRDTFNEELRKLTYYDACYGFRIIKVYTKKSDLIGDNMNTMVYYDSIFDTTQKDMSIIYSYLKKNSLELKDVEFTQQIEKIYDIFQKYYILSPEYEIKNIVHNAIEHMRSKTISPKKNSDGKIIINVTHIGTEIVWEEQSFTLHKDGILTSEKHAIDLNELHSATETVSSGLVVDTQALFNYLDELNIIVIHRAEYKRKVIDGEFCILKDNQKRFIYKRLENSWVPLSEEEVKHKGSCLLDQYKLKEAISLDFDDLLQLDVQDIREFDNSLIEESAYAQDKTGPGESSDTLSAAAEAVQAQQKPDVPALPKPPTSLESEYTETTVDATDTLVDEPTDLGDVSDLFDVPIDTTANSEQSSSSTTAQSGGSDVVIDNDPSDVPIGERVDITLSKSTPVSEESIEGFKHCIHVNNLPIKIKDLFLSDDGSTDVYEYKDIMIPKTFIKFIFTINKQFNTIREMSHIIDDKESLSELLIRKSSHIRSQLALMKRNYEERIVYVTPVDIIKKQRKKNKIPKHLLEEFNSLFFINDVDIMLTKLKQFIDDNGVYYKPDVYESTSNQYGDGSESISIPSIDPEKNEYTSKFIYWDVPRVSEILCCKHYIDLTELSWLNNEQRNKRMTTITKKYALTDHIEGDSIICKHCGETINYIQYSSQEGFGSNETPIQFRERIDDTEYQYQDDNVLDHSVRKKFHSKEILNVFIKLLNVKIVKDDIYFIESNSYKMYTLYEKNQKDIYLIYANRYYDRKLNDTVLSQFKEFYNDIIGRNPYVQYLFNKDIIEKIIISFMKKYYTGVKKKEYKTNVIVKHLIKYSSYMMKQMDIYNTTIQICLIMSYFIAVVFYSNQHYKIFSSGDARYTGQRFSIYDTLDKLKEKCIDIALSVKKSADKKNVWYQFINTEKIFKIEYSLEISRSEESSTSYYNSNMKDILTEHYFNDIYSKILKQPSILALQVQKEDYDRVLELKTQLLTTQISWNNFRPNMEPDYNYRNDTALITLETLIEELKQSKTNNKTYMLLSNISEEIKKLSLEYMSRINSYIILNKPISNIHYISYQSNCCYFNIQHNYQHDLSHEIKQIKDYIYKLDVTQYQYKSDYYILDSYRGVNSQNKGRYLLDYLHMKDILHQEYIYRQQSVDYSNSKKDEEYKEYLLKKIYQVHYYVVSKEFNEIYAGYKRSFIDVIDPDFSILSELNETDELRKSLTEKLTEKYKHIMGEYHMYETDIEQDIFNTFIQTKVDIIVDYNGETQQDLITGAYIYEIDARIQSIVNGQSVRELKELVNNLYHFIERDVKDKTYMNIDQSQYKKRFKRSRFKLDRHYSLLKRSTQIEYILQNVFDIDMDITKELVDNKNMERAIEDSKLVEIIEETNSFSQQIKRDAHDFMDIYRDPEGFGNINVSYGDVALSSSLGDILLTQLGGHTLLEEYNKYIKTDLIIQGYGRDKEKYELELSFRKKLIETNIQLDTIQTYLTASRSIIIEFNKLYYLIKNKNHLSTVLDDDDDQTSITYTFSNMYTDFSKLYSEQVSSGDMDDEMFNEERFFIVKYTEDVLKLLDIMTTMRNSHTIKNEDTTRNVLTIEYMLVLAKYIYMRLLVSFSSIELCKPFLQYILFNILDIQVQKNVTDEKIQEELIKYKTKLNEQRKVSFEKLPNDMKHLHKLFRNVNMGGQFSKRNEMDDTSILLESLEDIGSDIESTLSIPLTAEELYNHGQLELDAEAHAEYSMSHIGGEDNNDEI